MHDDINKFLNTPKIFNVCSYSEFEPICFADGKGFEPDLLRAIAKLWKVDIKFHPVKKYEDLWEKPADSGNYDVAAGGITPQKDRKENAIFSNPTAGYSQSLLVRREDYEAGKLTGYESFRNSNMLIGVVGDSAGEKFGHERAKEVGVNINIFKRYASESELLPALLNKEIDAIARGEIGNDFQVEQNPKLATIARHNFGEHFCFALAPDKISLLKLLNDAINIVTNNKKISYKEWQKNHNVFNQQVNV